MVPSIPRIPWGGGTLVKDVVESMIMLGIFDTPEDIVSRDWSLRNPCSAAVYHESLAQTIPRIRWLWRRRETASALQWRALCTAVGDDKRCDELASTVVRLVRLGGPRADRSARLALLDQARHDSDEVERSGVYDVPGRPPLRDDEKTPRDPEEIV